MRNFSISILDECWKEKKTKPKQVKTKPNEHKLGIFRLDKWKLGWLRYECIWHKLSSVQRCGHVSPAIEFKRCVWYYYVMWSNESSTGIAFTMCTLCLYAYTHAWYGTWSFAVNVFKHIKFFRSNSNSCYGKENKAKLRFDFMFIHGVFAAEKKIMRNFTS